MVCNRCKYYVNIMSGKLERKYYVSYVMKI